MSSEDPFDKGPFPRAGNGSSTAPDGSDLPVAESAEEQIAGLSARLDRLTDEKKGLEDRILRAAAELENYKKRVRRDQSEAARYAAEPLVRDLLPILDNLELAVAHADGNSAKLVEGVKLVLKSFEDVLRQHGVKPVEAEVGTPFDPNLHEAVDRREVDGEPNRIVLLWQRGYQMHDRLLRPARVVVSAERRSSSVAKGKDDG